jgi:hypothetical protein
MTDWKTRKWRREKGRLQHTIGGRERTRSPENGTSKLSGVYLTKSDVTLDQIAIRQASSRRCTTRRPKPSMPKMPWDDKPEEKN